MTHRMRHEGRKSATDSTLPYDDIVFSRGGRGVRQARASMPWWNPRYWRKRAWIGLGIVVAVVIIVVVAVAVAVAVSRRNAYPDYAPLAYGLSDTYAGETFFDRFNYFTGYDPDQGFVHYVPRPRAQELNLTHASAESAVVRVDTSVGPKTDPNASTGRFSVRLESQKTYDRGLFIFDIKHTPYACGAWPALWLTDPSHWPDHGEIDVMESVNRGAGGNLMTLHTTGGCSMGVRRKMTGRAQADDCDHAANRNAGCGVAGGDDSFGAALNARGGAVVAVEWRDAGIRMWQFARRAVPDDVARKKPDPARWGTAAADFPSTSCAVGSRFRNNSIVVNIDFCGDMVNTDWEKSGCPGKCTDVVANRPDLFQTAFWEFGKFEVYQPS